MDNLNRLNKRVDGLSPGPGRGLPRLGRRLGVASAVVIMAVSTGVAAGAASSGAPSSAGAAGAAAGCNAGEVRSFARVKGEVSNFPTIYTSSTSFVDTRKNCAGGTTVLVRKASTGVFFVRIPGDTSSLALVNSNSDSYGTESVMNDNVVSVAKVVDTDGLPSFRVEVQDVCGDCSNGTDATNGRFVIMTF